MTDVTGLELVGTGRTADVYAFGGGQVLRRYRDGGSAATEAAVMTHVRAHGFPAPAVHAATGPDLVLDRLTGPTLLQAVLGGELTAADAAVVLAGLHRRLHAVPPSGHARPAGSAADTVVHLDLHPDNVVLTPDGPALIDWRNATDGPADLDVVFSALILAQVAVSDEAGLAPFAAASIGPFLSAAGGAPLHHLDAAKARRGADPQLTPAERERLAAAAALVAEESRRGS
ncbi:phosphotransferase [Jiangella endophytica]|uniref:phosphotransferase n=1 Tax=Jiangella endophytica TaxID=1623398 RepID=UPI000E349353|nr:phosphotransferase [Jiangella endophytica]